MADATYFQFRAGGSFLRFVALQRDRCAISSIHPSGQLLRPPASSALSAATVPLSSVRAPAESGVSAFRMGQELPGKNCLSRTGKLIC